MTQYAVHVAWWYCLLTVFYVGVCIIIYLFSHHIFNFLSSESKQMYYLFRLILYLWRWLFDAATSHDIIIITCNLTDLLQIICLEHGALYRFWKTSWIISRRTRHMSLGLRTSQGHIAYNVQRCPLKMVLIIQPSSSGKMKLLDF